MDQKSKYRNFCFTVNNYTDEDIDILSKIDHKFMIIGKEVGSKGTPHLQGYMMFKSQRYFNSVRKLHPKWHLEIAMGTPKQNIEYCSKEKNFIEFGERPKGQGKRTDIDNIKSMIFAGDSIKEIYTAANSYQSFRMAEKGIELFEPKRAWKSKVFWFYGPTGSGKTKTAFEWCPEAWISLKNLKWWQGYDAHAEVILDDFRADFCTFHELLRILDRYPYTVEVKGGSRQLLAKVIIITSPFHPAFVYKSREDLGQLLRRIDEIWEFRSDGSMDQKSGVILCPDCKQHIDVCVCI